MIRRTTIKQLLLGMMIVLISLFLLVAVRIGVLIEKKSFRTSIHGRITDANGGPISKARISLFIGGSDGSENRFECTTHEDGYYSIQTATLRYALDTSAAYRVMSISADGYVPVSVDKRIPKGNSSDWNFQLPESVTASGRVINTRGEPVANCCLYFLPVGPAKIRSNLRHQATGTTTDKDGRFTSNTVGPFAYRIRRGEYGMQIYTQTPVSSEVVDLTDPANRRGLEIRIHDPLDYTISGHVKDSDGHPVAGAFVSTFNHEGTTWGAMSDRQGAFSIIGLDGYGKDSVDINVKGTSPSRRFPTRIPDIPLHTNDLSIIVNN
jgi:protocatechuate 3,4-dioxygenase beta subunit